MNRALLVFGAAMVAASLSTGACTYISGVESFQVRRPGDAGPDVAIGQPVDGGTGRPDGGAVDSGLDAGCQTALECQEQRCKADLPDSRLNAQVGAVLGVTATCLAGAPRVANPGPNHYYVADVRCTLVPQPSAAAVSSFTSEMNADGWFGYSTRQEGSEIVVVGQSTTRECSTY